MSSDDGPTDREPHSHSAGFGRVERLENAFEICWINARPGVAYCHEYALRVALRGADR